jgi:hypothetical protein
MNRCPSSGLPIYYNSGGPHFRNIAKVMNGKIQQIQIKSVAGAIRATLFKTELLFLEDRHRERVTLTLCSYDDEVLTRGYITEIELDT